MKPNNPFFHRGPIHDPLYFWNRTEELAQAHHLTQNSQSVAVVGPRRIGKSSLLLRLAEAINRASPCVRGVYFDCEGWSTAAAKSLYALLAASIGETDVSEGPLIEPTTANITYREFRDVVLTRVPQDVRLVWLLDEFEALASNPQLDETFFSGLRALTTTGRVTFVTASARSLGWLTFATPSALSSPFFNIFTQIRLPTFPRSSAAEMLQHFSAMQGRPFDASSIDFILDLAGPHPFFAQIAAYYAFERVDPRRGALTAHDRRWVRDEFVSQAEGHWQHAWLEIPPARRKEIALTVDWSRAAPDLVRRLRELALIVEGNNGWQWLSAELREYVAHQQIAGLVHAPPLIIDTTQHLVLLDGRTTEITGLEYGLLLLLAKSAGKVVLQSTIQATLWPQEADVVSGGTDSKGSNGFATPAGRDDRLKGVVKSLRRKLAPHDHLLQNVRGIGYTFAGQRVDRA